MSYKQKVRDIIEQLFHSTGLRKEDFIGYKQRLESRPFFEDYVFPHKLNATELKIKSDIAKIISATPLIESANDITAFDLGEYVPLNKSIYELLFPLYFRENSSNIGVGSSKGSSKV